MEFTCEFCNTIFNKKSSLKNHNKTAKYCLIKRGKIVIDETEEIIYFFSKLTFSELSTQSFTTLFQ